MATEKRNEIGTVGAQILAAMRDGSTSSIDLKGRVEALSKPKLDDPGQGGSRSDGRRLWLSLLSTVVKRNAHPQFYGM